MKNIIKKLYILFFVVLLSSVSFAGDIVNNFGGNATISLGKSSFTDSEKQLGEFEIYSDLDSLGRCGVAFANICQNIMPTEKRGSIGMIKPTGWQTPQNKYDFVDGKYLYNRCHLIAFELAGENANEKNLITGTRYMNIEGMLPYENKVANHVKSTNHHVLYRSTPIYEGNNLLCEGVQIEAFCLEENGGSIDFNVLCYNVQPGVEIDYATGKNWASDRNQINITNAISTINIENDSSIIEETGNYVLNTNTKRIHVPSCSAVAKMSEKNKKYINESIETIVAQGYTVCGICHAGGDSINNSNTQNSIQIENTIQNQVYEEGNSMVYISKSGKKYHSVPSCSNMKTPREVPEEEAISMGRTKCSKCW